MNYDSEDGIGEIKRGNPRKMFSCKYFMALTLGFVDTSSVSQYMFH